MALRVGLKNLTNELGTPAWDCGSYCGPSPLFLGAVSRVPDYGALLLCEKNPAHNWSR